LLQPTPQIALYKFNRTTLPLYHISQPHPEH
jgi:hypothetical protein